jgi:uncharacterized protein (TIGR03437 family)
MRPLMTVVGALSRAALKLCQAESMRFDGVWLLFMPCALAANVPTFTYSIPSSSGGVEVGAIATDSAGNTFIAGTAKLAFTGPNPIPTTSGAFQTQPGVGTCFVGSGGFGTPNFGPCPNAFVMKLDPTGAVVFATYLGGNGMTQGNAIVVDQQGNVYVAGVTSPNVDNANTFPVTPGAAFANPATGTAFIAKLNPSGGRLVYATFIPAVSLLAGLAVDPGGNAYITGTVNIQAFFPVTTGAFQVAPKSSSNQYPGFVVKLNASGSALAYATYLSGSGGPQGADSLNAIAVDATGDAFISGSTYSTDFPVTPGAFLTTSPGPGSAFLTKLNPQGSGLVFSTFLGESYLTVSVKLDAQGTAFVAGSTTSATFPTTPGAMTTGKGFLTRLSADGSSLTYSTYVPIAFNQSFAALDVDSAGNAAIAGPAPSSGLPTGVGAFNPEYAGDASDSYIARFAPNGQLSASTYLGGLSLLQAFAVAPNGSVVVAGYGGNSITYITNFFVSLTVLNAASYVPNAIAPGEIVSLLGYGIGPATGVSATGPALSTELAGVQVSFGGLPAPLLYVQSRVINAQVPWELAGQTSTTVLVSYPGVDSSGTPVAVGPSLPGVFGVNNSDGTQNSASNPAKPGDFITVYGTGGGSTSPAGVTGAFWPLSTPFPLLTLPVMVTVAGENAKVLYAGASPLSSSGIFQINALLPSDLQASSASSLVLSIDGTSSAAVPIAVQ